MLGIGFEWNSLDFQWILMKFDGLNGFEWIFFMGLNGFFNGLLVDLNGFKWILMDFLMDCLMDLNGFQMIVAP